VQLTRARRKPGGWEVALSLVLSIALAGLIIASLYSKDWQVDAKPIYFVTAGSLATLGLYILPLWVAVRVIRRRNHLVAITNLMLCQVLVALVISFGCSAFVLAEPIARIDLFLLRDGLAAHSPIYDVACGNLDRKIEELSEIRKFQDTTSKFDRVSQDLHRIAALGDRATAAQHEQVQRAYWTVVSSYPQAYRVHAARLHAIEADSARAWSRLRRSYPSLAVAYWLSAALFIGLFVTTAVHQVRMLVCAAPRNRRAVAAVAFVAAALVPFFVFGAYGMVQAYANFSHPQQALSNAINAAHAEAGQRAATCPHLSAHSLW